MDLTEIWISSATVRQQRLGGATDDKDKRRNPKAKNKKKMTMGYDAMGGGRSVFLKDSS